MKLIRACCILLLLLNYASAATQLPENAVVKKGKTLTSVLEQFTLDPDKDFPDAPYYDDARPTPLSFFDPPVPKSVTQYNELVKHSDGNYLLFGQGNNILQILLDEHTVNALQLNCAMHCRLSEQPNPTYQVYVQQNDKIVQLFGAHAIKQPFAYAAALPLTIAVNLGDKAAKDDPWQYLQIEFNPVSEEYLLYYWRGA